MEKTSTTYHVVDADFNYWTIDTPESPEGDRAAVLLIYKEQYPGRSSEEDKIFEGSGYASNGVLWVSDGNNSFLVSKDKDLIPAAFFELMFDGRKEG